MKWYYKYDEELTRVEELFKESFNFSPISVAYKQVMEAFECSGSVIEEVLCDVKVEPGAEALNAQVENATDVENSDFFKIVPIKEESFPNGPSFPNSATRDTVIRSNLLDTRSAGNCKICFRTFTSISGLSCHLIQHRIGKSYVCPICNRSFARLSAIIQHIRGHKSTKTPELRKTKSVLQDKKEIIEREDYETSIPRKSVMVKNSIFIQSKNS